MMRSILLRLGTAAFVSIFASTVLAQNSSTIIRSTVRGDPAAGKNLAKACDACHGDQGMSPIDGFPNLAGQNFNYLVKQLREMRTAAKARAENVTQAARATGAFGQRNQRSNETMDAVVVELVDVNIINLAAYYAGLKCTTQSNNAPEQPKIETRCQICHGKAGISRNRNIPNIAGQNKIYMTLQLQSYREAAKTPSGSAADGRSAPIMETQAASLAAADIDALSDYYSRLSCAK